MKQKAEDRGVLPICPSHRPFLDAIEVSNGGSLHSILSSCRHYISDVQLDLHHVAGLLDRIERELVAVLARSPWLVADQPWQPDSMRLYAESSIATTYVKFIAQLIRNCCNRRNFAFHRLLATLLGARSDELAFAAADALHYLLEPSLVYMAKEEDEAHPAEKDEYIRERLAPLAETWTGVANRLPLLGMEHMSGTEHMLRRGVAGTDEERGGPGDTLTLEACLNADDDALNSSGSAFFLEFCPESTATASTALQAALCAAVNEYCNAAEPSRAPGFVYRSCSDVRLILNAPVVRAALSDGELIPAWRVADAVATQWRVPSEARHTLLARVRTAIAFMPAGFQGTTGTVRDLQPSGRRVRAAMMDRQLKALTSFLRCRQSSASVRMLFSADDTRLADDIVQLIQGAVNGGPDRLVVPGVFTGNQTVEAPDSLIPSSVQASACLALMAMLTAQVEKNRPSEALDDGNDMLPSMASACRRLGIPLSRFQGMTTALHAQDVDSLEVTLGLPGTEGVPRDDCSVLLNWLEVVSAFSSVNPGEFPPALEAAAPMELRPFSAVPDADFFQPPTVDFAANIMRFVVEQLATTGWTSNGTDRAATLVRGVRKMLPAAACTSKHKGAQRVRWLMGSAVAAAFSAALSVNSSISSGVSSELRSSGTIDELALRAAVETDTHIRTRSLIVKVATSSGIAGDEMATGQKAAFKYVRVLPPPPESQRIMINCLLEAIYDAVQPGNTEDADEMADAARTGTGLLQPLEARLQSAPYSKHETVNLRTLQNVLSPIMEDDTGETEFENAVKASAEGVAGEYDVSFTLGRPMMEGLDDYAEHLATDSALTWAIKDTLAYPAAFGGSICHSTGMLLVELIQNDPTACNVVWDAGISPLYMRKILEANLPMHPGVVANMMAIVPALLFTESVRERVAAYHALRGGAVAPFSPQMSPMAQSSPTGLFPSPPALELSDLEMTGKMPLPIRELKPAADSTGLGASARASPASSSSRAGTGAAASRVRGQVFAPGYLDWALSHGNRAFSGFRVVCLADELLGTLPHHGYAVDSPYQVLLAGLMHSILGLFTMQPLRLTSHGTVDIQFAALATAGMHGCAPKMRFAVVAGTPVPLRCNLDLCSAGAVLDDGSFACNQFPGRAAPVWKPSSIFPSNVIAVQTAGDGEYSPSALTAGGCPVTLSTALSATAALLGAMHSPIGLFKGAYPGDAWKISVDSSFTCPAWDADEYSYSRFDTVGSGGMSLGCIDKRGATETARHCSEMVDALPGSTGVILEAIRLAFVGIARCACLCRDDHAVANSASGLEIGQDEVLNVRTAALDAILHRQLMSLQFGMGALCTFVRGVSRAVQTMSTNSAKALRGMAPAMVNGSVWSPTMWEAVLPKDASVFSPPSPQVHPPMHDASRNLALQSAAGRAAWGVFYCVMYLPELLDSIWIVLHGPLRGNLAIALASMDSSRAQEAVASSASCMRDSLIGVPDAERQAIQISRPCADASIKHIGAWELAASDPLAAVHELLALLSKQDYGGRLACRNLNLLVSLLRSVAAASPFHLSERMARVRALGEENALVHSKIAESLQHDSLACLLVMQDITFSGSPTAFGPYDMLAHLLHILLGQLEASLTTASNLRNIPAVARHTSPMDSDAPSSKLHGTYAWMSHWHANLVQSLLVADPEYGRRLMTVAAQAVSHRVFAVHRQDVASEVESIVNVTENVHACAVRRLSVKFATVMSAIGDVLVLLPPDLANASGLMFRGPTEHCEVTMLSNFTPYADLVCYGIADALDVFARAPDGFAVRYGADTVEARSNGAHEVLHCASVESCSAVLNVEMIARAAFGVDFTRFALCCLTGGESAVQEYLAMLKSSKSYTRDVEDNARVAAHVAVICGYRLNTAVLFAALRSGAINSVLSSAVAVLHVATSAGQDSNDAMHADGKQHAVLQKLSGRIAARGSATMATFFDVLMNLQYLNSSGYSMALCRGAARFHVALYLRATGQDILLKKGEERPLTQIDVPRQDFSLDDFCVAIRTTVAMHCTPVLARAVAGLLPPGLVRSLITVAEAVIHDSQLRNNADTGCASSSSGHRAVPPSLGDCALRLGCSLGSVAGLTANIVIPGAQPINRGEIFSVLAPDCLSDPLVASCAALRPVLLSQVKLAQDPLSGVGDGFLPNVVALQQPGIDETLLVCLGCHRVIGQTTMETRAILSCDCVGVKLLSTVTIRGVCTTSLQVADSISLKRQGLDQHRHPPATRLQIGPSDQVAIEELVAMGFDRSASISALRQTGGLGVSSSRRADAVRAAATALVTDNMMDDDSDAYDDTAAAASASNMPMETTVSQIAGVPAANEVLAGSSDILSANSEVLPVTPIHSLWSTHKFPLALLAGWGLAVNRVSPVNHVNLDLKRHPIELRMVAVERLPVIAAEAIAWLMKAAMQSANSGSKWACACASVYDSAFSLELAADSADLSIMAVRVALRLAERDMPDALVSLIQSLTVMAEETLGLWAAESPKAQAATLDLQGALVAFAQPAQSLAVSGRYPAVVFKAYMRLLDAFSALLLSSALPDQVLPQLADMVFLGGKIVANLRPEAALEAMVADSASSGALQVALPAVSISSSLPSIMQSLSSNMFASASHSLRWLDVIARCIDACPGAVGPGVLAFIAAIREIFGVAAPLSPLSASKLLPERRADQDQPVTGLLKSLLALSSRSPSGRFGRAGVEVLQDMQLAVTAVVTDLVTDVPAELWLAMRRFQQAFIVQAISRGEGVAAVEKKIAGMPDIALALPLHDVLYSLLKDKMHHPFYIMACVSAVQLAPSFRWVCDFPTVELLPDLIAFQQLQSLVGGVLHEGCNAPPSPEKSAPASEWLFSTMVRALQSTKRSPSGRPSLPPISRSDARRAVPIVTGGHGCSILNRVHASAVGLEMVLATLMPSRESVENSLKGISRDAWSAIGLPRGPERILATVSDTLRTASTAATAHQSLTSLMLKCLLPEPTAAHVALASQLMNAAVHAYDKQAAFDARAREACPPPSGSFVIAAQAIQLALETDPRMVTSILRMPGSVNTSIARTQSAVAAAFTGWNWQLSDSAKSPTGLEVLADEESLASPFLDWLILQVIPGLVFTDIHSGGATLADGRHPKATGRQYVSVFDDTSPLADPPVVTGVIGAVPELGSFLSPKAKAISIAVQPEPHQLDSSVQWRRALGDTASCAAGLIATIVRSCPPSSIIVDIVLRRLVAAMTLASSPDMRQAAISVFGAEERRMAALCSIAAIIRNAVLPAMAAKTMPSQHLANPDLDPAEYKSHIFIARVDALVRMNLHGVTAAISLAQLSLDLARGPAAVSTSRVMAVVHNCIRSDVTQETGRLAGEWTEHTLRYTAAFNGSANSLLEIGAAVRETVLAVSGAGSRQTAFRATGGDEAEFRPPAARMSLPHLNGDLWRGVVRNVHVLHDSLATRARSQSDAPQKFTKNIGEALKSIQKWRAAVMFGLPEHETLLSWCNHLQNRLSSLDAKRQLTDLAGMCRKLRDLCTTGRHPLSLSLGLAEAFFRQVAHLLAPLQRMISDISATAALMASFEFSKPDLAAHMPSTMLSLYGSTVDVRAAPSLTETLPKASVPMRALAPMASSRKRLRGASFSDPATPSSPVTTRLSPVHVSAGAVATLGTPVVQRRVRARAGSYSGGGVNVYDDAANMGEEQHVDLDGLNASEAVARLIRDASARGEAGHVEITLNYPGGGSGLPPGFIGEVLQQVAAGGHGIRVTAEMEDHDGHHSPSEMRGIGHDSDDDGDDGEDEGDEDGDENEDDDNGHADNFESGSDLGSNGQAFTSSEVSGGVGPGASGLFEAEGWLDNADGADGDSTSSPLDNPTGNLGGFPVGNEVMDAVGVEDEWAGLGTDGDEGDDFDEMSGDDSEGGSFGDDVSEASHADPPPASVDRLGSNSRGQASNWWEEIVDTNWPEDQQAEEPIDDTSIAPQSTDLGQILEADTAMSRARTIDVRTRGDEADGQATPEDVQFGMSGVTMPLAARLHRSSSFGVETSTVGGTVNLSDAVRRKKIVGNEPIVRKGTHKIGPFTISIVAEACCGLLSAPVSFARDKCKACSPVPGKPMLVSHKLRSQRDAHAGPWTADSLTSWVSVSESMTDSFSAQAEAMLFSVTASVDCSSCARWKPTYSNDEVLMSAVSMNEAGVQMTVAFMECLQSPPTLRDLVQQAWVARCSPAFDVEPTKALIGDIGILQFISCMPSAAMVVFAPDYGTTPTNRVLGRNPCIIPLSPTLAPAWSFALLAFGSDDQRVTQHLRSEQGKQTKQAQTGTRNDPQLYAMTQDILNACWYGGTPSVSSSVAAIPATARGAKAEEEKFGDGSGVVADHVDKGKQEHAPRTLSKLLPDFFGTTSDSAIQPYALAEKSRASVLATYSRTGPQRSTNIVGAQETVVDGFVTISPKMMILPVALICNGLRRSRNSFIGHPAILRLRSQLRESQKLSSRMVNNLNASSAENLCAGMHPSRQRLEYTTRDNANVEATADVSSQVDHSLPKGMQRKDVLRAWVSAAAAEVSGLPRDPYLRTHMTSILSTAWTAAKQVSGCDSSQLKRFSWAPCMETGLPPESVTKAIMALSLKARSIIPELSHNLETCSKYLLSLSRCSTCANSTELLGDGISGLMFGFRDALEAACASAKAASAFVAEVASHTDDISMIAGWLINTTLSTSNDGIENLFLWCNLQECQADGLANARRIVEAVFDIEDIATATSLANQFLNAANDTVVSFLTDMSLRVFICHRSQVSISDRAWIARPIEFYDLLAMDFEKRYVSGPSRQAAEGGSFVTLEPSVSVGAAHVPRGGISAEVSSHVAEQWSAIRTLASTLRSLSNASEFLSNPLLVDLCNMSGLYADEFEKRVCWLSGMAGLSFVFAHVALFGQLNKAVESDGARFNAAITRPATGVHAPPESLPPSGFDKDMWAAIPPELHAEAIAGWSAARKTRTWSAARKTRTSTIVMDARADLGRWLPSQEPSEEESMSIDADFDDSQEADDDDEAGGMESAVGNPYEVNPPEVKSPEVKPTFLLQLSGRSLRKPAPWTLESGLTLDSMSLLDDAGLATIVAVLKDLGAVVTTMSTAERREVVVPSATSALSTGALQAPDIRAPTPTVANPEDTQRQMTSAFGIVSSAPSPRLALERPQRFNDNGQLARLTSQAALRIASSTGGHLSGEAAREIGRQLTEAAMHAIGVQVPRSVIQAASATRGTAGSLAAGLQNNLIISQGLGINLRLTREDAAWQPTDPDANPDRGWRLHGRRRNDMMRIFGQGGHVDSAASADLLEAIRRHTRSDTSLVQSARGGVSPAAGTVVTGAKMSRRSQEGGNAQVMNYIHTEPLGCQFMELLARGTTDEIDGAILQRTATWLSAGLVDDKEWSSVNKRLGLVTTSSSAASESAGSSPLLVLRLSSAVEGMGLSEEQNMLLDAEVTFEETDHRAKKRVTEFLQREVALGALPSTNVRGILRIFFAGYSLATGTLTNLCRMLCAHSGTRRLLVDALIDILEDAANDARRYAPMVMGVDSEVLCAMGELDVSGYRRIAQPAFRKIDDLAPRAVKDFPPSTVFSPSILSAHGQQPMSHGRSVRKGKGSAFWPPAHTIARVFNVLGTLLAQDPRVTAYVLGGDAADQASMGIARGDMVIPPTASKVHAAQGESLVGKLLLGKRSRNDDSEATGSEKAAKQHPNSSAGASAGFEAGEVLSTPPSSSSIQTLAPIARLVAALRFPLYRTDVSSLSAHVTTLFGALRTLEPLAAVHAEAVTARARDQLQKHAFQLVLGKIETDVLPDVAMLSKLQVVLRDMAGKSALIAKPVLRVAAALADSITERDWPGVVSMVRSFLEKMRNSGIENKLDWAKALQVKYSPPRIHLQMIVSNALVGCNLDAKELASLCEAVVASSITAATNLSMHPSPLHHTAAMRHWTFTCGLLPALAAAISHVADFQKAAGKFPHSGNDGWFDHDHVILTAQLALTLSSAYDAFLSVLDLFSSGPRIRPLGSGLDLFFWPRGVQELGQNHMSKALQPEMTADAIGIALDFLHLSSSKPSVSALHHLSSLLSMIPDGMVKAAQSRPFNLVVPGWDLPEDWMNEHARDAVIRRDTGEVRSFWEPVSGYICITCEEMTPPVQDAPALKGSATTFPGGLQMADNNGGEVLLEEEKAVRASHEDCVSDAEQYGFTPLAKCRYTRGSYIRHSCRHHDTTKNVECSICVAVPSVGSGHKSSNFTGHIQLRHFWGYTSKGWDTGEESREPNLEKPCGFESEEATYQVGLDDKTGPLPRWDAALPTAGHADFSGFSSSHPLAQAALAVEKAVDAPSDLSSSHLHGLMLACMAGPPSAPLSSFGWHRLPDTFVERPHFVSFPAPCFGEPLLRALCTVLAYDSCTSIVAARVDATLRLLCGLPGNRSMISEQLEQVAAEMAGESRQAVSNVTSTVLELMNDNSSMQGAATRTGKSRMTRIPPDLIASTTRIYSPIRADEKFLRLIRTLRAIAPRPALVFIDSVTGKAEPVYDPDSSYTADKERNSDEMTDGPGRLQHVSAQAVFASLWSALDAALEQVVRLEGQRDTDRPRQANSLDATTGTGTSAVEPPSAVRPGTLSQRRVSLGSAPRPEPALQVPQVSGPSDGDDAEMQPVSAAPQMFSTDTVSTRMQLILGRFTPLILAFFAQNPIEADADMVSTCLDPEMLTSPAAIRQRRRQTEKARKVQTHTIDLAFLEHVHGNAPAPVFFGPLHGTTGSASGVSAGSGARADHDEKGASGKRRRLIKFVEDHREVLNALVRVDSNLLSGQLSLLVSARDARLHLDFYNKRAYFRMALKAYSPSREDSVPINIDRKEVLEQSHAAVMKLSVDQMRSKLELRFKHEEGIDVGGLTREWYELLARGMFNPDYCLFALSGDGITYQPHPLSALHVVNHQSWFQFVGRVVGKALADGYLLDAHFTRSMYKHMLGIPVTYHDMESLDAEMHKNLTRLLASPLEEQGLADSLNFIVTQESAVGGAPQDVPLVPGGDDITVTDGNKEAYVALLTERRMTGSILPQINAFLIGLAELVPPSLLSLFTPDELELLISGLPDIDVADLRANTEYGGWRPTDEVINWFWDAVDSFEPADKARLLMFVTGTSKVPLGGFKGLRSQRGPQRFNIQKANRGDVSLPVSHTCFNQLDLPVYSDPDILRDKLLVAIREGGEGFGIA